MKSLVILCLIGVAAANYFQQPTAVYSGISQHPYYGQQGWPGYDAGKGTFPHGATAIHPFATYTPYFNPSGVTPFNQPFRPQSFNPSSASNAPWAYFYNQGYNHNYPFAFPAAQFVYNKPPYYNPYVHNAASYFRNVYTPTNNAVNTESSVTVVQHNPAVSSVEQGDTGNVIKTGDVGNVGTGEKGGIPSTGYIQGTEGELRHILPLFIPIAVPVHLI